MYLPRYFEQMLKTSERFEKMRVVVLEGDSTDQTRELLELAREQAPTHPTAPFQLDVVRYDTGGPYWPSVDHEDRWRQLATCWNRCLAELQPTQYAVCVESDLVWDVETLSRLLELIGEWHVVYPLLWSTQDDVLYDIWGFRKNGLRFSPSPPHHPEWDGSPVFQVDTGGGMIVTTGDVMAKARWADEMCILKFPPEYWLGAVMRERVYHP